jgi:hypothetical protein
VRVRSSPRNGGRDGDSVSSSEGGGTRAPKTIETTTGEGVLTDGKRSGG